MKTWFSALLLMGFLVFNLSSCGQKGDLERPTPKKEPNQEQK